MRAATLLLVLFAGVDPTPWVESLAHKFDITAARGMFANISMGQGQEAPAEATLERLASAGGWAFLQNLHLMQSWGEQSPSPPGSSAPETKPCSSPLRSPSPQFLCSTGSWRS